MAKGIENQPFDNGLVTLDPLLSDRTPEWQKVWSWIHTRINVRTKGKYGEDPKKWPVAVGLGEFSPIDVEDSSSVRKAKSISSQNLYISCYLLSHVFQDFDNLNDFYTALVKRAPTGSKFLLVDRDAHFFEEAVENVAKSAKLKLSDFLHAESRTLSADEQISELGEIFGELK